MALMLAREVGDITTENRLTDIAEQEFGADYFAEDDDRFAWKLVMDEPHPRGQLNSLLILSEIGERGAWTNVYSGARETQFHLPTIEGVDYPHLGISEAKNDVGDETLWVSTYAATSDRRGSATSWKVTKLSNPQAVKVYCDDTQYSDWGVIGGDTIEINSRIAAHRFRIVVGPARDTASLDDASRSVVDVAPGPAVGASPASTTTARYRPAAPPSCACC